MIKSIEWHKQRLDARPFRIKLHKDILVVPFEYKSVKHYKCNFCDFRTTATNKNNSRNLMSHLNKVHSIIFRRGASQEVKMSNTILSLSHFTESTDTVKTWTCKYCGVLYILPTNKIKTVQVDAERRQIKEHMLSCDERKSKFRWRDKLPPIDN